MIVSYSMEILKSSFPNLSNHQLEQFLKFDNEFQLWNSKINLVSRKDIIHFESHHLIHSLSISKVFDFPKNTTVIDLGTGGGLPGIPLAILYPETQFFLVESIRKKINVVRELTHLLELKNVTPIHARIETIEKQVDYIISRWVGPTKEIIKMVYQKGRITFRDQHKSGLWLWKGGNLSEELRDIDQAETYDLNEHFDQPFYSTKKILHIPKKSIITFADKMLQHG
ncbi:MAG: 16S rRNA (guanine(527)-N(7))-methyltransferase RsmG [Flavobacteriaceae bacterium]|nr:16S rRNA (guanine(527)-N(7))-methyltransferase RsmG [Flavobacteriaceae bacterium]MCY4267736.1 16S rRNA (guanine(527)-N(7))-methyltransferase RsmG [Flavobacteriaceae bacterium]